VGIRAAGDVARRGELEVVGGMRDADATTLELQKTTSEGKKSFGTARMVKEGGAYKVAAEAWRN
jgi:hypothetical protein